MIRIRFRPRGSNSGASSLLLAAGILAWAADARAGFDGWRGDLNGLYESSREATGVYPDRFAPVEGISGWTDWQWHWVRSGIGIQAGIEGEFLASLFQRNSRLGQGGAAVHELNLKIPFGDSGSGSQIQIGAFPIRPGKDPDLFGNYLARYEPYPGVIPYYPWSSDSLGSTQSPGAGLRAALGLPGAGLRPEFLALWDRGDVSFLAYLDGALPNGFDWEMGLGWRNALASESRRKRENYLVWAETDSGYLPIDYAREAGLAYTDSGGITATGWNLSARLSWTRNDEAMGRFGAFGEAGLLGIANQPLYYEDRWRRVAATLGAYLPTWGLFQICLIQAEWRPIAYRMNDAIRARSGERNVFASDAVSAWSYAALLGRDFGRHWALRGRIAYAPRARAYGTSRVYGAIPEPDPYWAALDRDRSEVTAQIRAVFRFGRRD
jgi:hypothetical protein